MAGNSGGRVKKLPDGTIAKVRFKRQREETPESSDAPNVRARTLEESLPAPRATTRSTRSSSRAQPSSALVSNRQSARADNYERIASHFRNNQTSRSNDQEGPSASDNTRQFTPINPRTQEPPQQYVNPQDTVHELVSPPQSGAKGRNRLPQLRLAAHANSYPSRHMLPQPQAYPSTTQSFYSPSPATTIASSAPAPGSSRAVTAHDRSLHGLYTGPALPPNSTTALNTPAPDPIQLAAAWTYEWNSHQYHILFQPVSQTFTTLSFPEFQCLFTYWFCFQAAMPGNSPTSRVTLDYIGGENGGPLLAQRQQRVMGEMNFWELGDDVGYAREAGWVPMVYVLTGGTPKFDGGQGDAETLRMGRVIANFLQYPRNDQYGNRPVGRGTMR